ncbi:MAG: adenosylcobalamin-dependent ribonucleoside-diphosphate reductase [Myxococcales bacterium]|nr:adenosylcobalamin-dependent ribonucleoside-diphosphate reductase [Myxococcales bacterium]
MESLSANALRVLEARYLQRDDAGGLIENFEGLCRRVADAVAAAEDAFGGDAQQHADVFFAALRQREFLPNSPTLMNAGTEVGQLSACFVLPVEDSIESIFDALKHMALIHKTGGGTGFSLSHLRPAGDRVGPHRGVASGPVSFLGVFDAATAAVVQGGRRRGANMGVLRVDHPDIRAFVRAKRDSDRFTNFNLSVATTDAFWRAARSGGAFDLLHPRDGKVVESVRAAALLDEIAEAAWACGDPGVIFLDAVERANPTPRLGPLEATNPCGELPLLPNESCNLGSIRLDAFVGDGRLDMERLDATVDLAVRFLDDVIEVNRAPLPEVAAQTRATRKIGLGVMGFADALVDLGIPYDAPQAAEIAERVMTRIRSRAERASAHLAQERGAFPAWAGSRLAERGLRLRNATLTSIAPTGTISIVADCASGIEPYFALAFVRHVLSGERLAEVNARFEAALRDAAAWSPDRVAELARSGSAREMADLPESIRRLFPVAADLTPTAHLAIQAAFQRHVDNAVSKTINLPADATPATIREIYASAWQLGLKGVTVFREGCKGGVLERGVLGVGAEDLECLGRAGRCAA